jgi:hypothetical protein
MPEINDVAALAALDVIPDQYHSRTRVAQRTALAELSRFLDDHPDLPMLAGLDFGTVRTDREIECEAQTWTPSEHDLIAVAQWAEAGRAALVAEPRSGGAHVKTRVRVGEHTTIVVWAYVPVPDATEVIGVAAVQATFDAKTDRVDKVLDQLA